MKKFYKIISCSFIYLILFVSGPTAFAQIGIPHPYVDFSGTFIGIQPVCLNGMLVEVVTPVPLLLLLPYAPVGPIEPIFKLWGPIPGAATIGNFLPGGVCLLPTFGLFGMVVVPIPVMGMLVQIGTTLVPAPYFVPIMP